MSPARMDFRDKGISLAVLAAIISGVSVFVNGFAVKLTDATSYTLAKNIGALVFLVAAVALLGEAKNFRNLSRKQWLYLIAIGLIGGSVPFAMFFYGLQLGGAAISSFLFRSLFVFAGVFGYIVLKERPDTKDIIAGLAILAGNALLIDGPASFGIAQLLVLGATILWALEYTISRKVMQKEMGTVNPRVVMVSRMFFGSIVLMAMLALNGSLGSVLSIPDDPVLLGWLLVTSSLLFAFLLSWYLSIRSIPMLKATSIFALGGVVTAILDLLLRGKPLTSVSGTGLFIVFIGVSMMVWFSSHMTIRGAFDKLVLGAKRIFIG